MKSIAITIACGFSLLAGVQVAAAQVVPDRTVGTTVSPTNLIDGGTRSGNNLFHSFSQFSIPTNGSAIFNNSADIQNIFSRVTGNTQSSIDGLIKAQGNANLFLINPSGILFGPNAKLDIGGSFIGTTANTIKFADGVQFSANDLNPNPLLTVTTPIGLQMGQNPGEITVQGSGNLLKTQSTLLAPYISTGPSSGLQVAPRQTLALIGGNITIVGGILTAPEGRVELVSLGNAGSVPIVQNQPTLTLGNTMGDVLRSVVDHRANIQLSNQALIDVNGIDSGSIQIQGKQVDLTTGAILWVQNRGEKIGGNITVNATDRILADGTSPDIVAPNGSIFRTISGITNETVSAGNNGKIILSAPSITVQNGANILNRSFASGTGGDLIINAKTFNVSGASSIQGDIVSIVGTITAGTGRGGHVILSVQDMALLNGGVLGALTIGEGSSGDITVNADTILVRGLSPILSASSLSIATLGGTGKADNLIINTRTLEISEGAIIASSSFGPGNAGNITINATESLSIRGVKQVVGNYETGLSSTVAPPLEPYKSLFNLPENNATGSSGSVIINTPKLSLSNRAYIVVENTGSGLAGELRVNADRIEINSGASLSASSESGQGGNIIIRSDSLLLRNRGDIYTNSQGGGNGGNINITANSLVGIEDSDIIASAVKGRGGNIQIKTQGLIGLKYRPQLTPDSDITASSDLGFQFNGTVQINSLELDRHLNFPTLAEEIIDSSQLISKGCSDRSNSNFIITGHGGLPSRLLGMSGIERTWGDIRPITTITTTATQPITPIQNLKSKIVEVTRIQTNIDGTIALVDDIATIVNRSAATCATFSN